MNFVKNPLCLLHLHNWRYKKEKHPVTNHPAGREVVRVIVRECVWCNERQQHLLPRENKKLSDWKKCNFDEKSCLEFKNL